MEEELEQVETIEEDEYIIDNNTADIYTQQNPRIERRNTRNHRRPTNLSQRPSNEGTLKRNQRMMNRPQANTKNKSTNSLSAGKNNSNNKWKNPLSRNNNGSNKDNKFKIKIPIKLIIIGIIVTVALLVISLPIIFIIILIGDGEDSSSSTSGGGSLIYGKNCTTVNITDTGCDSNGNNCTNEYNGSISLENYVAGVVAAEADGVANLEYYKLLATLARTYYWKNTNDDCSIKGNITTQPYISIDNSVDAELIKQAVEETKGFVLTENEDLTDSLPSLACVVNADDNYYYVRYGRNSSNGPQIQQIPKQFDNENTIYKGYLAKAYATVDQNDTDYQNKLCPANEKDYGMSKIGALYLLTQENYSYEQVINNYYGDNVKIEENKMQLDGINGFINPTRIINCTSAYGKRIHPKTNEEQFHNGLDIGIVGGEPIYAVKDGNISSIVNNISSINNCNYGYGNYIVIDHGDGTTTLYAHIKYGSIPNSLVVGEEVSQGTQIGQVGSTGCSTGNHLHYEVKVDGSNVDPTDYLNLTEATGTCKR